MGSSCLQHFTSLDSALTALIGGGVTIVRRDRIAGGYINEAYRLTLTDGSCLFMKANSKENASFFSAEAEGLHAIAKTEAIGTPEILCSGTDETGAGCSFLLMEFIAGKSRIPDYWETFARELAAMHRAETADFVPGGAFGFVRENFIGAGAQVNTAHDSWISFFRDCRLEPQFRHADSFFQPSDIRKIGRLLDHIGEILVEPEHPSLLHGDLWSGNVITGNDGKAWIIDPAVYVGHAEADLAMTELFGGFPPAFYDAYREAAPMQPGYHHRRDLYNLYQLLNHLNLFGRSYFPAVMRIVERYAA